MLILDHFNRVLRKIQEVLAWVLQVRQRLVLETKLDVKLVLRELRLNVFFVVAGYFILCISKKVFDFRFHVAILGFSVIG